MTLAVTLDGVDVSSIAQEATSHHWLNRKYIGTVKIPVADAWVPSDGARLKIVDDDLPIQPLDFHGTVKFLSAADGEGEEDGEGLAEYTAESAREIWEWRPARDGPSDGDDPGNYISPDFLERLEQGPLVMEDVLLQSLDDSDPAAGEGPMAMVLGSFPSGGISLAGAPMSTPMMIDALANLLTSTGELDIIETMIDSGGDMSQIDCYDGNYGFDNSADADFVFEPDGTARSVKFTWDASKLVNKLRLLLGPRAPLPANDPNQWRRSIEATNMDIPDTSTYTQADLLAAIGVDQTTGATVNGSRAAWMVRADIRIFDSFANESDAVPLYWRLWQDESMWRLQPRRLYTLRPREGTLPAFDIGDLVGAGAYAGFMGGFSGKQRVFGRKLTWDVNGVVSLDAIETSADSESLA